MTESQKSFEILKILDRLTTLFGALTAEKSAIYCEKLEPFPVSVIRRAVEKTADEFVPMGKVIFPSVAQIKKHCEFIARSDSPYATATNGVMPWEAQERDRKMLVREFMERFSHSMLMADAHADGYEDDLRRYVHEIASIQVQIIIPKRNGIGLSWATIEIPGFDRQQQETFQREFLREMVRIVGLAGNNIEVSVPIRKIEQWIETKQYRKNKPTGRPQTSRYESELMKSLGKVAEKMKQPLEEVYGDIHADFLP